MPTIDCVEECVEIILSKSEVGVPRFRGSTPGEGVMEIKMNKGTERVETLQHLARAATVLGHRVGRGESGRVFKLVKIKDRFSGDELEGYRDICLNVEVAWTISSESEDTLEFLPVLDEMGEPNWEGRHDIRTHICEIQLMLQNMYHLKTSGCHANFVKSRDLLAQ